MTEAALARTRGIGSAASSRARLGIRTSVLLELPEERLELVELLGAESRQQALVEGLHRSQHLGVLRATRVRELDADGAPVVRVAATDDEPLLFETVDVARERRALDVERARELVLRSPLLALQVREDEPRRHRAADLRERVVERAPDVLRGVGELQADRSSWWTHGPIVAF